MTTAEDITRIEIGEDIFNDVYLPELENNAQTQIAYGGASSGKSYFYVAQRTTIDIMKGGRNYLVCRKTKEDIRSSVFEEIEKFIKNWGLEDEFKINQTNMKITCIANGYQISFRGLQDTSKLKSVTCGRGVITDILVEEATEITSQDLKQLEKRLRGKDVFSPDVAEMPKRITLLFNPILKTHWIYKKFFSPINWEEDQTRYVSDELTILKTTYKDNRFLTEEDISRLENEEDEYWYDVYTLGNWGVLGDVIFKQGKNWEVRDLTDMIPGFDNLRHGIDFGFVHPDAYLKTHYDKKREFIYVIYEYRLGGGDMDILYKAVKDHVGYDYVMCDSADPRSINKLKTLGLKVKATKKGKDSVRYGITWLKVRKIIIHIDCIRFRQEIETLQWKKDKYGESLPSPVERDDDLFAALRYQYEDDMKELPSQKPINVRR